MPELIRYSEAELQELRASGFGELYARFEPGCINWLNLETSAIADFELMVNELGLHPLMVEDILSKAQLPKFEMFDQVGFMSLQMIYRHGLTAMPVREHVSLLLGENYVISIQENREGDVFDHVRQKLRVNYKRMSKNGAEYLFLNLIDAVVDEYLAMLETYRAPIEDMEVTMIRKPAYNLLPRIMEYKGELNGLRKFTIPLREEMQRIRTENPNLIRKQNLPLFRDIIDHLGVLQSHFENFREMLRDLTDLHHSNQNLMLNNTMKTLTVISAIFIPLTFIVGVYGMNFEVMPEIHWKYGYYFIWLVMLLITGGLVWYMRRKKWF
ncbi:MAG: magnesium/cobalt transporter CorA [Bacteroidetes bacterium]|nr:magnesium/cobalt transporter CorA [Bacteroidota bacterium]